MPHYRIVYSKKAKDNLYSFDVGVALRITKKLEYFIEAPDPLSLAKSLSGNLDGLYRYRVGDYRIIFSVGKDGSVIILNILYIAHRKDIYR